MNTQRDFLLYGGLAIALASALSLSTNSYSHDGDTDKIHACVREGNGRVRFVQPDDDCGQLNPLNAWDPVHWSIGGGDDDWSGAGSGRLRPSNLSDSVSVGTDADSAKLHVETEAGDSDIAFETNPQGNHGLRVDSQGNVIVGERVGTKARLAVYADENEDAFRARIGGLTHFIAIQTKEEAILTPVRALQGSRLLSINYFSEALSHCSYQPESAIFYPCLVPQPQRISLSR